MFTGRGDEDRREIPGDISLRAKVWRTGEQLCVCVGGGFTGEGGPVSWRDTQGRCTSPLKAKVWRTVVCADIRGKLFTAISFVYFNGLIVYSHCQTLRLVSSSVNTPLESGSIFVKIFKTTALQNENYNGKLLGILTHISFL